MKVSRAHLVEIIKEEISNYVLEKEIESAVNEKAVSKKQQQASAIAFSAKKGKIPPSELKGSSKRMYDSMTQSELEDFASTKHSGLPVRK